MVTLGAGQRTDILVTANGSSTDAVFMRSDISNFCVNQDLTHSQPHALAAIYYEEADRNKTPTSTARYYDDNGCHNVSQILAKLSIGEAYTKIIFQDDLNMTVPLFPFGSAPTADYTIHLHVDFGYNGTAGNLLDPKGSRQWFVNNSTFHANYK